MRKTLVILALILLVSAALYAINASVYFPTRTTKSILPTDDKIGQIADKTESSENLYLSLILSKEFNLAWTESNFSKDSAKALSAIYSKVLSEHIPTVDYLMSKPFKNSDGSVSIAVKFTDGVVVTFVVNNNQICGMSV